MSIFMNIALAAAAAGSSSPSAVEINWTPVNETSPTSSAAAERRLELTAELLQFRVFPFLMNAVVSSDNCWCDPERHNTTYKQWKIQARRRSVKTELGFPLKVNLNTPVCISNQ